MIPTIADPTSRAPEASVETLRAHESLMNIVGTFAYGVGGMAAAGAATHQQAPGALVAAILIVPALIKGTDMALTIAHPMTAAKAATTNATCIGLNAMLLGAQTIARMVDKRRGPKNYEPA